MKTSTEALTEARGNLLGFGYRRVAQILLSTAAMTTQRPAGGGWLVLAVAFLAALSVKPAFGLPIVAVDMEPATLGIQANTQATVGTSVTLAVVVSGVEVASPLNAFQFDIDFDGSILSPTAVVDGGFLIAPVFVVQQVLGSITVEFAEATLLPTGASGSGTLALVTFDVIDLGTSALDLNDVILSAPFGVQIGTETILDGSLEAVPEPRAAVLLTLAALLVWARPGARSAGI